ncbi:hypothetical protein BY458DRAFT_503624 [Sporodiniella umbellata]|nr:hypothetical protein BY458DRAFT_503624 [Sporodiniella umbellata]
MMAGYCIDYLSYKWEADDIVQTYRETRKRSIEHKINLLEKQEKHDKHDDYKSKRLQNALWREMARKCTSKLSQSNKMVDPSSMCWQKESDITWLYGPIYTTSTQTQASRPVHSHRGIKPVLKKQYSAVPPYSDDIRFLKYHSSTNTSFSTSRSSSFSSISTSASSSSTKVGVHFNPEITKIEYQPEYPVSPTSFPFSDDDPSIILLLLSLIKTLTYSTLWSFYQRYSYSFREKKKQ